MKKILFSLLIVSSLFAGCKKDESSSSNNGGGNNNPVTPTYYFSFKANGQLMEWTNFSAAKDDTINPSFLFISAAKALSPEKNFFGITLMQPVSGWGDGTIYVLDETQLISKVEYKDDGGYIYKSTAAPKADGSGLTINFTKMPMNSGGVLEGTFSGILKLEENESRVQITEGKFKIKQMN